MKPPFKRQCGASLPDRDAEEDQHYCRYLAGHSGSHRDDSDEWVWADNDVVEVHTVEEIRAVADHVHVFRSDAHGESACAKEACTLTYNAHTRRTREWEEEQADTCSHCGHAEHCHTRENRDEGDRPYCTECQGADEYHVFDEEPQDPREALAASMRDILGPDVPEAVLRLILDRVDRYTEEAPTRW